MQEVPLDSIELASTIEAHQADTSQKSDPNLAGIKLSDTLLNQTSLQEAAEVVDPDVGRDNAETVQTDN